MKQLWILVIFNILVWTVSGCRSASGTVYNRQSIVAPRIVSVTTEPELPNQGGWLILPPGPGEVTLRISAENVSQVTAWLVPSGTDQRKNAKEIGEDVNAEDGWSIKWQFESEDVMAHILVQAIGPGGVMEDESLQVYREN